MAAKILAHWHVLIDNYHTSGLAFYDALEKAVEQREIPKAKVSRVFWEEGGVGSAKREYLRVRRKRVTFDVCAAPYGTGFFFSWWLAERPLPLRWLLFLVSVGLVGAIWLLWAYFLGSYGSGLLGLLLVPGLSLLSVLMLGAMQSAHQFFPDEVVLGIPIIGLLYGWLFGPETYYRHDVALMFQEAVKSAVNEALEVMQNEHGLRSLSVGEATPHFRDLV